MNELNYASREASQRLVDAGIVLETEAAWFRPFGDTRWFLELDTDENRAKYGEYIPAPSMAEVWRELPSSAELRDLAEKYIDMLCPQTTWDEEKAWDIVRNPDLLIDLLIWTKGGKG